MANYGPPGGQGNPALPAPLLLLSLPQDISGGSTCCQNSTAAQPEPGAALFLQLGGDFRVTGHSILLLTVTIFLLAQYDAEICYRYYLAAKGRGTHGFIINHHLSNRRREGDAHSAEFDQRLAPLDYFADVYGDLFFHRHKAFGHNF